MADMTATSDGQSMGGGHSSIRPPDAVECNMPQRLQPLYLATVSTNYKTPALADNLSLPSPLSWSRPRRLIQPPQQAAHNGYRRSGDLLRIEAGAVEVDLC